MEKTVYTYEQLEAEIKRLNQELEESRETIEAIRSGQVDALVVEGKNGKELYTLHSADHNYRILIEKMTEGAVTLDETGNVIYCNTRFAAMMDLQPSRVIGESFRQFIAAEHRAKFDACLKRAWRQDCKEELVLSNPAATVVLLSLTTLALDGGVVLSLILTDLTGQKKVQAQLKQKNEELEKANLALERSNYDLQQFASVASHDLQEPLRKVLVFSSYIKEAELSQLTEGSRIYLGKIITAAERMRKLIIDILGYSRLSADDPGMERIDLNQLIQELLGDYEIAIREKKAQITIDPLPSIEGNKGQITQVFQNILSNALKFHKPNEDPVIRIAVSVDDCFCEIRITDNGIGFNEKYAENIFSLFERLNTKDLYEGSGIGLAIAKKIIDKHHGRITVKSEPDVGSEFTIVLPINQPIADAL